MSIQISTYTDEEYDIETISLATDCTNTWGLSPKSFVISTMSVHGEHGDHTVAVAKVTADIDAFIALSGVPHMTSLFDQYGNCIWYDGHVTYSNGVSGYIAKFSSPNAHYEDIRSDIEDVESDINTKLRTKQYKLVAGDFIVINGDVISYRIPSYMLPQATGTTRGGVRLNQRVIHSPIVGDHLFSGSAIYSELSGKQPSGVNPGYGIAMSGNGVGMLFDSLSDGGLWTASNAVCSHDIKLALDRKNPILSFDSQFVTSSKVDEGGVYGVDILVTDIISGGHYGVVSSGKLNSELSSTQSMLSAGNFITISEDVISAHIVPTAASADDDKFGAVYLTDSLNDAVTSKVLTVGKTRENLDKKANLMSFSKDFSNDSLTSVSLSFSDSGVVSGGAIYSALQPKMDAGHTFSSTDFNADGSYSIKYGEFEDGETPVRASLIHAALAEKHDNLSFNTDDFVNSNCHISLNSVDVSSASQNSPVSGGSLFVELATKLDNVTFDDSVFETDATSIPNSITIKFSKNTNGDDEDGIVAESKSMKELFDLKHDKRSFNSRDFIVSTDIGSTSISSVKTWGMTEQTGAVAGSSVFYAMSSMPRMFTLNADDFVVVGGRHTLNKHSDTSVRETNGTYYASAVALAVNTKKSDFTFGGLFDVGDTVGISFTPIAAESSGSVAASAFKTIIDTKLNSTGFDTSQFVSSESVGVVSLSVSTYEPYEATSIPVAVSNSALKDALDDKQNIISFSSIYFDGCGGGETKTPKKTNTIESGSTRMVVGSSAHVALAELENNLTFDSGLSANPDNKLCMAYSVSDGVCSNVSLSSALSKLQPKLTTVADGNLTIDENGNVFKSDFRSMATCSESGYVFFDNRPLSSITTGNTVTVPSSSIHAALQTKMGLFEFHSGEFCREYGSSISLSSGGSENPNGPINYSTLSSLTAAAYTYGAGDNITLTLVGDSYVVSKTDTTYGHADKDNYGLVKYGNPNTQSLSQSDCTISAGMIVSSLAVPRWMDYSDDSAITSDRYLTYDENNRTFSSNHIGLQFADSIESAKDSKKLVTGGMIYTEANTKSDWLTFAGGEFTQTCYVHGSDTDVRLATSDASAISANSTAIVSGGALYEYIGGVLNPNFVFPEPEELEEPEEGMYQYVLSSNTMNVIDMYDSERKLGNVNILFTLHCDRIGSSYANVGLLFIPPENDGSQTSAKATIRFNDISSSGYINFLENDDSGYRMYDDVYLGTTEYKPYHLYTIVFERTGSGENEYRFIGSHTELYQITQS